MFIPPVVSGLLTVIANYRINQLRVEQKKLIKEWGEGIAIGPRAIEAREAAENQGNTSGETPTQAEEGFPRQQNESNGVPELQTPPTS